MAVNGSQSYAPYGEVFGASGTMSSPFAFTGEPLDGNGQVYLRARYYNPSIGVFNALDPFEGSVGRPMSLNGYSWVEGNPVMNIDPTGEVITNPNDNPDTFLASVLNSGGCGIPSVFSDMFTLSETNTDNPMLVQYPDWLDNGCLETCYMEGMWNLLIPGLGDSRVDSCVRECFAEKARNAGGCQIELFSWNVNYLNSLIPPEVIGNTALDGIQPNHAFIVLWEDPSRVNGKVYSAFPSGNPMDSPFIAYERDVNDPNADYAQWQTSGGVGPVLVMGGEQACRKQRCLQSVVNLINSRPDIRYNFLTQNSNSAARGMLERCEIPGIPPYHHGDIGTGLPGWENRVWVDESI